MLAVYVFAGSLAGMLCLYGLASFEENRGRRIMGNARMKADRIVARTAALFGIELPEAGKTVVRQSLRAVIVHGGMAAIRFLRRIEARLALLVRTGMKRDPRAEKKFISDPGRKL